MIRNWLILFALWLLRRCGYREVLPIPTSVSEILPRVGSLIRTTASLYGEDRSDENLRHLVYSRLIKEYPRTRRRDLALAIELAVRETP